MKILTLKQKITSLLIGVILTFMTSIVFAENINETIDRLKGMQGVSVSQESDKIVITCDYNLFFD